MITIEDVKHGILYDLSRNGVVLKNCYCVYDYKSAPSSVCFMTLSAMEKFDIVKLFSSKISVCRTSTKCTDNGIRLVAIAVHKEYAVSYKAVRKSKRNKAYKIFEGLLQLLIDQNNAYAERFKDRCGNCMVCESMISLMLHEGLSNCVKAKSCIGDYK